MLNKQKTQSLLYVVHSNRGDKLWASAGPGTPPASPAEDAVMTRDPQLLWLPPVSSSYPPGHHRANLFVSGARREEASPVTEEETIRRATQKASGPKRHMSLPLMFHCSACMPVAQLAARQPGNSLLHTWPAKEREKVQDHSTDTYRLYDSQTQLRRPEKANRNSSVLIHPKTA